MSLIVEGVRPGDVVAERFEIASMARSGGMGTVYRARDRETGNAVALKVAHDGGSSSAQREVREAILLSELTHPRIVRYVALAEALRAIGDEPGARLAARAAKDHVLHASRSIRDTRAREAHDRVRENARALALADGP